MSTQRNDSIANYVSGLGTEFDIQTQGRPTYQFRLSQFELDILYLQNDLARRIVDELVEDALRPGYVAVDAETSQPIEEPDTLHIDDAILQAAKNGRLYGAGAVILIPKSGATDMMQPRKSGDPDFRNLLVLDRFEMSPLRYEKDPGNVNFGEAVVYSISPNTRGGGILGYPKVHESRMLMFGGARLPRRLRSINDDFDDSVLQVVYEAIRQFTQSQQAIANIIQRFETATISISGLADVLSADDGGELILQRMQLMQRTLSLINAAVIDADAGESYERKFATVTGLDTLWDRLAHSVARAAKMPMTQLFGMSPAGLGNDDRSGRANWRKQVGAYQRHELRPALERYYTALNNGRPVKVKFNPMDETTPVEEAEILKMRAETRKIYVEAALASPEDFRDQMIEEGVLRDPTPEDKSETDLDNVEETDLIPPPYQMDSTNAEGDWIPSKEAQGKARRALELSSEWGRGGTEVGKATARMIVEGRVPRERLGRVVGFLERAAEYYAPGKKEADGGPTAGTIAYDLWGGEPALPSVREAYEKTREDASLVSGKAVPTIIRERGSEILGAWVRAYNTSWNAQDEDVAPSERHANATESAMEETDDARPETEEDSYLDSVIALDDIDCEIVRVDSKASLTEKAKGTSASVQTLQKVYDRGVGAYRRNPGSVKSGVSSPEQWAMGRVNSFLRILSGKKTTKLHDLDLLPESHPKSSKGKQDES